MAQPDARMERSESPGPVECNDSTPKGLQIASCAARNPFIP